MVTDSSHRWDRHVETAHMASLSKADKADIWELIMLINMQEMLQDIDNMLVQQSVTEQVETVGEPSTGDLQDIVELFDWFANKLNNDDPNNARA